MNSTLIICPKCKAEIPLTDAMEHQVRERIEKEFASKQREMLDALAVREQAVAEKAQTVEEAQRTVERQVAEQLTVKRKALVVQAEETARQSFRVELDDLRHQLEDRQQKLAQAQNSELELRKQQRELENRAKEMELEVARKLDAEREKIREQASSAATEAERLRVAEKEKLISDLQQQIVVLKQKAEQGSVQLQGAVLELDLASQLAAAFPHDVVLEVSTGVRGADVQQTIQTNAGHPCGMILWETKRTKNWSGGWTDKLKEDMRAAKAEIAVLVTQVLPDGVKHFGFVDGVWVCDYASALPLAVALRSGLIKAAMVRLAETGKVGKMEQLYAYLCSSEFRQHVEAVVESFSAMQDDLQRERRAMEKIWSGREKQIARALQHTAQIYGGIQGIAGQIALPEIKSLALEDACAPLAVAVN